MHQATPLRAQPGPVSSDREQAERGLHWIRGVDRRITGLANRLWRFALVDQEGTEPRFRIEPDGRLSPAGLERCWPETPAEVRYGLMANTLRIVPTASDVTPVQSVQVASVLSAREPLAETEAEARFFETFQQSNG